MATGSSRERWRAPGATVVASDFSAVFVERARAHAAEAGLDIAYSVADATDETQIKALGAPKSFDAAVCTMAVHDIADLAPMARAVAALVRAWRPVRAVRDAPLLQRHQPGVRRGDVG